MSGEKKLPPTPARIRQAREQGQLGVSQDAVKIIRLLVIAEIAFGLEAYWRRLLADMFDGALQSISRPGPISLDGAWDSFVTMALLLLVMASLAMLLAVIATFAQTKFNVAPKALSKGIDQMNPGNNLKQLFMGQKLLMAVLGPVKGGLLIWVCYLEIRDQLPLVVQTYRISASQGWSLTMALLQSVERNAIIVLIILLITDILLQRYITWRQLRMDISEVKRDHKQNEGDPMLKGTRKQIAKELVLADGAAAPRQRPSAVTVNPEHIAIALLYEPDEMDLPIVLEAVTDDEAQALRRDARAMGVPVIKYVPLARHLLASGKPGEPVPEHTYRGVALLFRVIEEYEKLAPELLRPSFVAGEQEDLLPLAAVEEALGESMFEMP